MALNNYTIALLRAIQSGTAYFVPNTSVGRFGVPAVDRNGTAGTGRIHFPGEEQFGIISRNFRGSDGLPVQRPIISGRGANTLFAPGSSFTALQKLYGGQDETLLTLRNIQIDPATNKTIPAADINSIAGIQGSGGPTGWSQALGAAALGYLMPGVGSALASGLGISSTAGTALATLGSQIVQGKDLQSALTNTALATAGASAGSGVNSAVDSALSGLGTVGDTLGNIAGGATSGFISSGGKADPLALLQAGSLGAAVSSITAEIPGYDSLSTATKQAVNNAVAAQLQGRDPTSSLINAALSAGKSVIANSTNVPTEAQVAAQQDDFQKQFSQYLDTAPAAQDDGTTAGIQDVINDIQTRPQDDGTTAGIQDVIGTVTGGSLGDESDLPPAAEEEPQCAPGYHWNGSLCVANTDVEDTSTTCPDGYLFDLATQSCVPIGTTTSGGGTKAPTNTTTPKTPAAPGTPTAPKTTAAPTTPATPTAPTTPTTPGGQLDLQSLLALLGNADSAGQAATPPPTVDIGAQLDLGAALQVKPFAKQQTQSKMASGGSIDDLLAMLQQRG